LINESQCASISFIGENYLGVELLSQEERVVTSGVESAT
jgi:hypothetical protein